MKTAVFALLLLACAPAPAAWAHRHHTSFVNCGCCDANSPVFWARRCAASAADFAITSGNRSVDLILGRREVVLQLSDRTWHRIDRELRDEREEEEGFLADAIKGVVIGAVRDLLDHSMRCPLDEVRDAEYRHGRLELTSVDGKRLFAHVDVEDRNVMESFSEADARAFVAEFHRLKGLRS